jgi:SAM-dependent methyltransferase
LNLIPARFRPWLLRLLLGGRSAELARWNLKVMGSELARQRAEQGLVGERVVLPAQPLHVGLTSRVCRQADIEADWLRHWCAPLRCWPMYHRKLWEDCFVLQALWEQGMLEPGRRGLGFAVGREQLPSLLAARGVEVTATDLDRRDRRARMWSGSNQHAGSADGLYYAHHLDRASFDARVNCRSADMRRIPAALEQGYDFLWSVCAFEHLGTLERGLDFVVAAMRCLRPGGVAVHTTEYNLDSVGSTVGRGLTVLYQRRHLEALAARLAAAGHEMLALDEPAPEALGVMDRLIDLPPYPYGGFPLGLLPFGAHLRLDVGGRPATSVGIIIRARG